LTLQEGSVGMRIVNNSDPQGKTRKWDQYLPILGIVISDCFWNQIAFRTGMVWCWSFKKKFKEFYLFKKSRFPFKETNLT